MIALCSQLRRLRFFGRWDGEGELEIYPRWRAKLVQTRQKPVISAGTK